HNPFHPALLSNVPLFDFGLFLNTTGSKTPPVNITVRQSRQSGVARATCPD
ncbi:hypothetical protein G4380_15870, partial [Coprococcus comes]|nr:hypothetical protein [Coprococcus comes]